MKNVIAKVREALPFVGVCLGLLALDLFVYGLLVPIMGAVVATWVAKFLNIGFLGEQSMALAIVVGISYAIVYFRLEIGFWQHLFWRGRAYQWILVMRTTVNLLTLAIGLHYLQKVVFSTQGLHEANYCGMDGGCKKLRLGDGVGLVFWNGLKNLGVPLPSSIATAYSPAKVTEQSWWKKKWAAIKFSPEEEDKAHFDEMGNLSTYLLALCVICACVTKMLYFNMLNNFLRATSLFSQMQNDEAFLPPGSDSLDSIGGDDFATSSTSMVVNGGSASSVRRLGIGRVGEPIGSLGHLVH